MFRNILSLFTIFRKQEKIRTKNNIFLKYLPFNIVVCYNNYNRVNIIYFISNLYQKTIKGLRPLFVYCSERKNYKDGERKNLQNPICRNSRTRG